MDEYAVISVNRLEQLMEEKAFALTENYQLKERIRQLEEVLLKAYSNEDTYYAVIDKTIIANLLNVKEADND